MNDADFFFFFLFFKHLTKVKGVLLLNQKVATNQFCHSEETLVFRQQRVNAEKLDRFHSTLSSQF